ncbi:PASTA domain-containing protein [Nocardioides sp. cx-173]|uniref:PASTA domain-containing protein n=1 Tax=Nocardioides sp. cx-173 TaxID=2898796 RepID=UPI001E2963B0|nr:PASTA domain-containing protein [Nocardioides sp. cx-173]MCD4527210.1 PASTA domain-containing protein [Nocardioides sp. cx-173]UGB40433.1 PASTA domain-containing protein [Nocardioides sp. cx-173]
MTDQDLSELLERAAQRVAVGGAPLPQMLVDGGRLRRRRAMLRSLVAAVAVVAVAGGTALASAGDPAPSKGTDPLPAADVPAGTRLVGVGHAAIAVPETWSVNATRCGVATEPTVVIDVTVVETCAWLGPRVFDNVSVDHAGTRSLSEPLQEAEVDGVAVQRGTTTCEPTGNGLRRCVGGVFVPSSNAFFEAEAASRERVDEILSWVRVVPDLVAVPGFESVNLDHQDDDSAAHYRADLERAGLEVEVVTQRQPGGKPGYVLGVRPAPGAMLEPGGVVTVTEVAEPRGPADEVRVEVNSVGPGDRMDYRGRTDAQIRAGTTIRLPVGARIWAYGDGRRIGTLAGAVTGSALALDDWQEGPNYGRSWKAVAPGRSTLTLTITADGRSVTIGTVTVQVG